MLAFFRKFGLVMILIQVLVLLMGQKALIEDVSKSSMLSEVGRLDAWHWAVALASVVTLALVKRRFRSRAIGTNEVENDKV